MTTKMPFDIVNNMLVLNTSDAETIIGSAFTGHLFGFEVIIDHITVVRSSISQFDAWCEILTRLGTAVLEPPCRWPTESCPELELPSQFEMMMATYQATNGSLVLAAPVSSNDLLTHHLQQHSDQVLHHAAIRVDDVHEALPKWQARGFKSGLVIDDGALVQVFLRHNSGQLLELIQRRDHSQATFSCANIAQLRQAESTFAQTNEPQVIDGITVA